MIPESSLSTRTQQKPIEKKEKTETKDLPPDYLDVTQVMSNKNCYFVHMIQTDESQLNVSLNNEAIDTKKLSFSDRLDLLKVGKLNLSASSIRFGNQTDTTFYGHFGVLLSKGTIDSAHPRDDGSVAKATSERVFVGGSANSEKDVLLAIEKKDTFGTDYSSQYNEIAIKNSEIAGSFLKADGLREDIIYENYESEEVFNRPYGLAKIGIIGLETKYDSRGRVINKSDTLIKNLVIAKEKGRFFIMLENKMHVVLKVDENNKKIIFNPIPTNPETISGTAGKESVNKYEAEEILKRLKRS
jgi:hypothetical protein